MLVAVLCALFTGSAWATDPDYTFTLASGDFTTSAHQKESGALTWTVSYGTGITESYGWDNSYGFKFGSGNSSYPTAFTLTSSSVSSKIKKVVVTANVNSKKSCKLDVTVGSTTYGSQATINTKSNDTWEFEVADASTVNGAVELNFSSNTGPLYLKQIDIYYYSSPTTFSVTYNGNGNTSGTVPTDATAYASGATVTVLGNTGSLAKTGYTFGGWNTQADGLGTDRAVGSTFQISAATTLYAKWNAKTITGLTYTGTPTKTSYYAGENFNPTGLTVSATFDDSSVEDVTTSVSWTPAPLTAGTTSVTGTYMGQTINVTGLTVTVAPGSAPENAYTVSEAIAAIDAAGKTTVSDKYVTGIVSQVDAISSNAITYWISDDGTTTNQFEVYKGKGISGANFSAVDDIKVGDVVVVSGNITYYSNGSVYEFVSGSNLVSQKLVAPTFYPAAGAVGSGTELTISDAHTDATIYYTTDGSTPTTSSTQYNSSSKPTITAATTFKAIAVKSGCENSDVASASYTILAPVATPEITLAGGTYSSAQTTTITCETAGATIYYTTNGDNPTTSSTVYSGAISINESMTIKAIAAKTGLANSAVAEASYTISIPVINAANVNITCEDTESSIVYTITNPDGGTLTAAITGGNEGSWMTLGAVSASAVAFTCSTNSAETARTTTVTLTYTYDTNKTVTKEVTITQAKHEEVIAPAVAGVGAFVKVTDNDDLTNGTYLIVYEGDATVAFDGSLTKLDAAYNGVKVNIIGGKIESSAATATVTFDIRPSDNTIQSKSGYYIYRSSKKNGLDSATETDYTNTISIDESGNAVITASTIDYILRYNYASDQLRFRYFASGQQAIALYKYDATETPFATTKFNSEGYATFSSVAKIDLSGTKDFSAWQVTNISSDNIITFEEVTSVVPASTGLLLKGAAGEISVLTVTDDAATALSGNKLVGIAEATTVVADEYYGLSGKTFVKVNAGKVPAGKALLPANLVTVNGDVKSFTFRFEDSTTGITTIDNVQLDNDQIFNLAGQRISNGQLKRGLYIRNGKKVVVK